VDVRALGARKRRLVEPTDSLSAPGSEAAGSPGAPSNQRAAPVLALIRRLPLEIVDPAGAPEEPATPPG
jgi:hypothetical protein